MRNTGKTIDELHKGVPIVKFPKKEIVILKIHKSILKRPTIEKCIKIAWRIDNRKVERCKILLAVNEGLIEDIFEIDRIVKCKGEKYRKKIFVNSIKDKKLIKKYVGKLIPVFYRKRRHTYPVRYNFYIERGIVIFYP